MANTPWQRRIHRANDLIAKHAFASEVLGFYVHVAGFQDLLYQQLESKRGVVPSASQIFPNASRQDAGASLAPQFGAVPFLSNFSKFLSLIEAKAPAHFAQVARDLKDSAADSWAELLAFGWSSTGELLAPREFLALAFLQPCAEFVRASAVFQLESYTLALCPLCHRKPVAGVLRQQGDGGRRSLLCGFCLTEWDFRRVICPGCGEEEHAKLPVYTAESFPHIRVECCDSCRTYLKTIDLTKNGLAEALVDELAHVPLDLWAQERGYAKLRHNLLGM